MYIASLWVFMSCVLLSLSIKKHYASTIGQSKNSRRFIQNLFRVCGFASLIFSFALFFDLHGLALGLVYLIAIFTVASLIQTLLLSYLTKWINRTSLVLVLTITVFTLYEESTQLQTLVAYLG